MIINNIFCALFAAWILSWFGFDKIVIDGMQQFFNITINSHGYYFGAAMIGLAAGLLGVNI